MLYPVQTSSRAVMDLSGVWEFQLDNGHAFSEKWFERPLPNSTAMAVPASYNDLKEGETHKLGVLPAPLLRTLFSAEPASRAAYGGGDPYRKGLS